MMLPVKNLNLNEKVIVTAESWRNIQISSKSVLASPNIDFTEKMKSYIGKTATVTHKFLPGYEVNITFDDGQTFQVKDHWVELVPE